MAELIPSAKGERSHRGAATRLLLAALPEILRLDGPDGLR